MDERIVFPRWRDVPEIERMTAGMEELAERHARLAESGRAEDRSEARKLHARLSDGYWDLLFALLDAQTTALPERLTFDGNERLFIDFGFLGTRVTPVHKDFDAMRALGSRSGAGVFSCLAFSDYIAECWAGITGNPCPDPVGGPSAEERVEAMEAQLEDLQARRDAELLRILGGGRGGATDPEKLVSDLDRNLFSAIRVGMRVKEYREAGNALRETMAQERFRYVEAERVMGLRISSARKDEAQPLGLPEAERFMELHESTKRLARKILHARADAGKAARRVQRIVDGCAEFSDLMKRRELKNMLTKKREYVAVPAKTARCTASLLCPSDAAPVPYAEAAALLETLSDHDLDMLSVPRVRMYGVPRVIFIPGQGLGTYDWQDHSLLLPAFPSGAAEQSLSYALGTFRWDSDEDRVLKNPYGQIREHRSKSVLDMAASFCKDYCVWMTRERKGYRVLPRETHNAFQGMFAPRRDD